MDRPTTREEADARGNRLAPHEAFILPSRRPALDLCREARGAGLVLVTGEAGVGKTWLRKRLESEADPSCPWLCVDLTPADAPIDLYRLIGHELGLVGPGPSSLSRVDLVDFLAERLADGEKRTLVVEEAQNLSSALWEEIRVMANRLDRSGGFAAILLVGQTALARRFLTRPFAAIEARLAARVHLGPIDADEAREMLVRLYPDRIWSIDEVEALHRDAAGNPRRMLRRIGPIPRISPARAVAKETVRIVEPPLAALASPVPIIAPPPSVAAPLVGPAKPPIRVEDNMIEVGWSPEDSPSPIEDNNSSRSPGASPATQEGEEAVHDHYAALQAWREWSENQGRRGPSVSPAEMVEREVDLAEDELEEDEEPSPLAGRPMVWADGEQKFAPFGQLFSRMAQVREPESP